MDFTETHLGSSSFTGTCVAERAENGRCVHGVRVVSGRCVGGVRARSKRVWAGRGRDAVGGFL